MTNLYHGSWLRHCAETAVALAKSPRRQFQRWFGRAAARGSPEASRHLDRIWKYVREAKRDEAVAYAFEIEQNARRNNDRKMLWWVSELFAGLDQYDAQARCSYDSRRMEAKSPENDWDGTPSTGTLVVDFRHRTPAWPLRHARFIASALRRAERCVVVCESRLVPLFERTFPAADVRGEGDVAALMRDADDVINHQDLPYFFGRSAADIEAAFHPLRPDSAARERFRQRYRQNNRPVIGLAWGSSNQAKEAPAFHDWGNILTGVPATFVSLQYGPIGPALRKLRRYAGDRLVHDNAFDQMSDLDQFAAQVASLDAIISTSSTVVHLAGVLGVPSIVILDENLVTWPLFGNRIPWYPQTELVHRRWRPWSSVMNEARLSLDAVLRQKLRQSD